MVTLSVVVVAVAGIMSGLLPSRVERLKSLLQRWMVAECCDCCGWVVVVTVVDGG